MLTNKNKNNLGLLQMAIYQWIARYGRNGYSSGHIVYQNWGTNT